ncbi:adenylyl-sulfate kinase [Cellulomonas chitinilytica]|uniref:Adenylyl-sulfate kinase n=1 Tax=Cellulomonas chitinilytica TaxID=398759 RepID=A0A919P191_9CELL|nr:AAA family ATPase [Cellulomonas chitinilytica]GIG21521.1 adenylyl-sulfate kinase [Cellulomonas chitinilytica]
MHDVHSTSGSRPALVVLGGLPGSGKTTLARGVARALRAVHVRVDTVEQAVLHSSLGVPAVAEAGYAAAMGVAADNLRLGLDVVADSVNPVAASQDGWRWVGAESGARVVEILVVCTDPVAHRGRVEGREADIPGHVQPTWEGVATTELDAWASAAVLDTAGATPEESVAAALALVARER